MTNHGRIFELIQDSRIVLIAGPCVIEDEQSPKQLARDILEICSSEGVPLIFKASFRKDNRTRHDSFSGIGDQRGLQVLAEIRDTLQIPVTTDIHRIEDAELAASCVDILQIPAFLCRQTSLLQAAAATGKPINVKKGQFMSPGSMQFVVEKLKHFGCDEVLLTERGSFFGYQDLVVDFRSIMVMQHLAPVVFDCTHSNQRPNQSSGISGGDPSMITALARAAAAVGAKIFFVETHPEPSQALSDGANMLPLASVPDFIRGLVSITDVMHELRDDQAPG